MGFRLIRTVAVSHSPSIDKPTSVSSAIETGRDGRFIANSNGTVLDTSTNLMWAAKDNGSDIHWANAKSYCEHYRGVGYMDWRMPTQDELAGLYDANKKNRPGYHVLDLIEITACCLWASEIRGPDAAYFDFYNGTRDWIHRSNAYRYRVLPVRSVKLDVSLGNLKSEYKF